MPRFISHAVPFAIAIMLLSPLSARAQITDVHGLGDAILNLNRDVTGSQQHVLDNLFSGHVDATILDSDGNTTNFQDGDIIAFSLAPVRSRSGIAPLVFSGNRASFDDFIERNAQQVLAILFPASMTESVTGIDVAQQHSQEFLVSTVLASGRGDIAGRVEFENFDVDQTSGNALQGLFRWKIASFEGRYAKLNDTLDTKSFTGGASVHPYWQRGETAKNFKVGADGYFSTMYSQSTGLSVDSLDYGVGPWGAYHQEFNRVTATIGGIVLGSDTHIPSIDSDFQFVADAINERGFRWDMTLGGAVETRLTNTVAIGGQFLHSQSLKSENDSGRSSQLFLADFIYRLKTGTRLDFGYRYTTGDDNYQANAVFMNATFAFD